MNDIIVINMDRYSLEHDAIQLLAKDLHLGEEVINAFMYNLWIDEKHTGLSHLEARQQLEDWFDRPGQSIMWRDVMIVIAIARRDIDVLALRTVRAWLALKSGRVPPLRWLPPEVCDESYREFIERNTHPGFVALELTPLEAIVAPDKERGSHIVMKRKYTVNLVAEAFVKGILEVEVNPTCLEREIERVAIGQSSNVIWSYNGTIDGTVRVDGIKQTGEITVRRK